MAEGQGSESARQNRNRSAIVIGAITSISLPKFIFRTIAGSFNSFLRFSDWFWKRPGRLPRVMLAAGLLLWLAGAFVATYWSSRAGAIVIGVALVLFGLTFVWYPLASVKKALPNATTWPVVAVDVTALVFVVGFPLVMLALATNGASAAGVYSTGTVGYLELASVAAIPGLVIVLPEVLWRRLPWSRALPRAQELVPAWLAAGAVVATWSYIFLLRFGGGPFSGKKYTEGYSRTAN